MKSLFVRKFTAQERQENREKLAALTRKVLKEADATDEEITVAVEAPLLPL